MVADDGEVDHQETCQRRAAICHSQHQKVTLFAKEKAGKCQKNKNSLMVLQDSNAKNGDIKPSEGRTKQAATTGNSR